MGTEVRFIAFDTGDNTFKLIVGEDARQSFTTAYGDDLKSGRMRYYRLSDIEPGTWYLQANGESGMSDIPPFTPIAY